MIDLYLKEFRLRVFKAVDDIESCKVYLEEHENVLKHYGITKVTSLNTSWFYDPYVYVLMIESIDGKIAYAGARVHIANDVTRLPLEEAIMELDENINEYIKERAKWGTAEVCGLWNSKKASGFGLATVFIMRAAVALSTKLEIGTLLAFCAQHTIDICKVKGFEVELSIGNKGTYYYPKEDLIATAMIIKDISTLNLANEFERKIIFELREKPFITRQEFTPKDMTISINYNLL